MGKEPEANRPASGVFITFEGGEGAGKSTQAALLVRRLKDVGHATIALREPGGTALGEALRDWLKSSRHPLTAETELFLFLAARAELVRTVIRPALAARKVVVLDRYADSTAVYQGAGRGLDRRAVAAANRMATGGLEPDITFLLDVAPSVGLGRAAGREGEEGHRRFEDAGLAFHRRVRQGFLRLARRAPPRWVVIDSTMPLEETAERIWEHASAVVAQRA